MACANPDCVAVAEGYAPVARQVRSDPFPIEKRSGDVRPGPDEGSYISTKPVPVGILRFHVVDLELTRGD